MIVDRIENAKLYAGFGHGVPEALSYLARSDLARLSNGKQEIDGDRLYAVVQRYQGKPTSAARWEYHQKYLDLQFVVAGDELMGYAPWDERLPVEVPYDPAKDAGFMSASGVLLPVSAGMFAVFAPRELHAPGLATNPTKPDVFKIVVKCRWEE
jgi:YhcH/YjgK/YiaL family protein